MLISTGSVVYGLKNEEFEVSDFVDRGGFGTVYKAKSRSTGDVVALKTLVAPFVDKTELEMFSNEAQSATEILHPNVLRYFYYHDGTTHPFLPPYLIMEYADGGNLSGLLKKQAITGSPFDAKTLTEMFQQLADGMKAINEKLVHRDLKPANILASSGKLKIADFGLAKFASAATRSVTFKGFGTLPYIAPEVWRGEKNTLQMDIYALGMVFFEMATLRPAFDIKSDDVDGWRDAHLFKAIPNPLTISKNMGVELAQIIIRMVEKNTAKRLSSWQQILDLLGKNMTSTVTKGTLLKDMLAKRLAKDSEAQTAAALAEQLRLAESERCKIAISQVRQDIADPLSEFVEEFNAAYPGSKASFRWNPSSEHTADCKIAMPSGVRLEMKFRVLSDAEFQRNVQTHDFGRIFTRIEIQRPRLRGRNILVWGTIKASDGRGFNFALVETGQTYGEWFTIRNRMGFPSNARQRPEPFPFEDSEMEKELRVLGAMHIYSSDVAPLDIEAVKQFIAEYV
jgi:serine/threonine protein kinase